MSYKKCYVCSSTKICNNYDKGPCPPTLIPLGPNKVVRDRKRAAYEKNIQDMFNKMDSIGSSKTIDSFVDLTGRKSK